LLSDGGGVMGALGGGGRWMERGKREGGREERARESRKEVTVNRRGN
jgi:hypothetical protein